MLALSERREDTDVKEEVSAKGPGATGITHHWGRRSVQGTGEIPSVVARVVQSDSLRVFPKLGQPV